MTNYNYEMQRQTLIDYLQLMVSRADWHGVSLVLFVVPV